MNSMSLLLCSHDLSMLDEWLRGRDSMLDLLATARSEALRTCMSMG